MNSIDPLQLQRLADGQLDLPAIKQLLADAQSNPQHWQMIASTMIEQLLLERSFQENSDVSDVPQDFFANASKTTSTDRDGLDRTKQSHSSSDAGARPWNWFAIVAGVMVAGLVGYLAGNSGDQGNSGANIVANSTGPASLPEKKLTPAAYQPDYHLEIPANSQWAKSNHLSPTGRVPLYSVGNQDQLKQFRQHRKATEEFDPEMLRRLAAAGYQIKTDVELISGDLNDREKYIVPVRSIRLIPSQ